MTKPKKEFLRLLWKLKYATANNLSSHTAQTVAGARLQAYKHLQSLVADELIAPLPFKGKTTQPRKEIFFRITAKGAKEIGVEDSYRCYSEPKSINNADHESSKIDVAMAFLRLYSLYSIDFEYDSKIEGLSPDILVKMKSPDLKSEYHFWVEIERKEYPGRTFREKLLKIEKMLSKVDFKKYGLSDKIKVLTVWNDLFFDCYARPQEYSDDLLIQKRGHLEHHFNRLVEMSRGLPAYRYRFLSFPDFFKLNQAVWFTPTAQKVQLIN